MRFPVFSLLLISSFFQLWLEKIFHMISVLKFVETFCDLTCDLYWRMLYVTWEEYISSCCWVKFLCMSIRSFWSLWWSNFIFCTLDLSQYFFLSFPNQDIYAAFSSLKHKSCKHTYLISKSSFFPPPKMSHISSLNFYSLFPL